jgi:hypothetical protein
VCQKFSQDLQMSPTAFVEEAADKAKWLVQRETRGPGDLDNAMRRLEARYGIPFATFYNLRYRKPKEIFVSAYIAVLAAYEAERERQQRLLEHERTIETAKTGVAGYFSRAADALARAHNRVKDDE